MPDTPQLLAFIFAGLLLNLTPGPDVFFIVTNALRNGARAGLVAALGITAGCCVHIVAAAVGVSALVAASATAFTLLKWIGAAYLVYVGAAMLLSRAKPLAMPQHERAAVAMAPGGLWRVFRRGFLTNTLNPKVALFFLAFVPQFIAPETANKPLAFLLLGTLFNVNAIFVNVGWALLAGWTARRVGAVRRGMHWLERGAGALFIGFGVRLALAENPGAAPSVH
jgi:RhtB (resistance to homoserine/threonine) family protein